MNLKEWAASQGVSYATARRWFAAGKLPVPAYQAGRPMVTLPVIAAVTPVASVAVGIGLLGEAPRTGVTGGVAAGLAVLVTSLALARLACSIPHPEVPNHRPADREPGGLTVLPAAASSLTAWQTV